MLQYFGSLNYTSGGVVRLCLGKKKYLICDNGWDSLDASVLCQSIGYSSYGMLAVHVDKIMQVDLLNNNRKTQRQTR